MGRGKNAEPRVGDERAARRIDGRAMFAVSFALAAVAWAACIILQLLMYGRPAPHGGPMLAEWARYLGLAIYYDLLGVWLLSLPFFMVWLARYRRPVAGRGWRLLALVQLVALALNLLLSAIDHEVLRFLGVRLNPSFLIAYGRPEMLGDALFLDVLRADQGGPFVSLLLVTAVPAGFVWWGLHRLRRPPQRTWPLWIALLLTAVPLAAPANGWRMATSQFRLRKVEPVVLAIATDLAVGFADLEAPSDFERLARQHREAWLAASTDPGWRFPDSTRPYLRVPISPAGRAEQWNIVYIQLETLRGADTGFLRPDRRPSPTPFLDSLAGRPDAAVWTRASSFGMPSINAIFASHCSVMPPSRRYITALTHVRFLCLPDVLRRHGYRAEIFHAADTDWDNSSHWLRRWYDRTWRDPAAGGEDRAAFRHASRRLRALGRSGRPFFFALMSATNHTPFRNPEPGLNVAGTGSAAERILNTTRYTDAALQDFLTSLRGEPWLQRTLIIVTGDHGFNVGEHGQVPGQHNLFRESVWVPLIIIGAHPRLPRGRHDQIATLLDLPPTVADLLALRIANPWQGHSLLARSGRGGIAFGFRDSLLAETPAWTAVRDPHDGRARLYRRDDWLQQQDLASVQPGLAEHLLARADRARRLNDFLLRNDRIWSDSSDF
jgi:hypothetical protein